MAYLNNAIALLQPHTYANGEEESISRVMMPCLKTVVKIPELFQSVDHYLGSYVFPLLEETRAELASAMDTIHAAPIAEVISLSEANPSDKDTLLYDVKVDSWKNRLIDCGSKPYRTLPGDVILLSNGKPSAAADLQCVGWKWTFASVTNIAESENDDNIVSTNFKVKAGKFFGVGDGLGKSLYVIFLMNITTNERIWSVLSMSKNLTIIETVLCKNNLAEEICEPCSQRDSQLNVKIRTTLLSKLNESQNEAILSSVQRLQCDHKSSVKLIWGPPGTGKTRTLSVMLFSLLRISARTLICTPTNMAIIDLASRVIKIMRKSYEAESEDFLSCPLGDILIFWNKDGLEVCSDIKEISLKYRVDKLVQCFDLETGWNHSIASMICFLVDSVSLHQKHVELIKTKRSFQDEVHKTESRSLLEFARDQFKSADLPLRRCMLALFTHLPRSYLGEQNFQYMVQLVSLLDSLKKLLSQENLTSEEFENNFSCQGSECSSKSSLLYARTQCLSVLRSLHFSLARHGLPREMSKDKIMEFCFQMASLIFCTASSSFKLHSVNMKPLKLLVIDEAAQLKECESIIPLQLPGLRHAILVGDDWQLPASVISKLSEEAGFGRCLFGRLSSLGYSRHLLNVQYRMHPSISRFPNSNFYHNKMLDATSVKGKNYGRSCLPGRMYGPYSFINVFGGKEEMDDVRRSRRNMVEVAVIVNIVHQLFKVWNDSKEKLSIGVISPYAAQVVAIQDKLTVENHERFIVTVKSIEGFQGGEEDIIIISTVRSNNNGSSGFLSCPKRTMVALTRARHCLWILGNERTLMSSNSVWEAIIRDCKDRQCFFNADEDGELVKTIIEVKKELDQLDDLLNEENMLFKSARWKVLFSDYFRISFGKLMSPRLKNSVICFLLKISTGWRPKRRSVDLMCETSLQIVMQFKVEGYYLVCTVDVVKEFHYEQVLKVWDILFLEEIPKFLIRLDTIFNSYTDDFINHCKEKYLDGNLEVPKCWPISHDIVRYKNINNIKFESYSSGCDVDGRSFFENSKVSESFLLMKFYFLSAGVVSYLLSDHEGRELDLPFEVTDEEREIILFPRSSFILGRSGTGKTTVLTMKLCRNIQQYSIASEGFSSAKSCMSLSNRAGVSQGTSGFNNILHQLFVTVNPKLCYAVKQYVSLLKSFVGNGLYADSSSIDIDDIDEMGQFQDIPDTFMGIHPDKYPLVITFHKFIMMLDGTLGNSYFERFAEVKGFSRDNRNSRSVALQTFIRRKEVNYDHFCFSYWPHFNQKLTRNLDPSRVFTEIMSHIKGGLQTGVSREDYVSLSERRISTLSAHEREAIYDIFKDYEKLKMKYSEFDLADLVMNLHVRLNNEKLKGDKMDFVYIDEVQDLSMRQISLFKYICKNVDEGFVFSGDTAQTIARGVDFRFEDIRYLFYKEFVMKSKNIGFTGRREKGLISDMFNLCQNFRTHSGVLRVAQSVIDLLSHFFPQSFDVLAPETSFVYGEPPVVLQTGSDENAIITIFGGNGNFGGKMAGFGAEQVILVRDDSARKEISNHVGHQALILTIVESKGLEFQDVLLYNFFGSSPLRTQWRVVYEFLKEKDLLDSSFPKSSPGFSQLRHSVLCSELKQLYVAITRTRQRLWIWENTEELFKPMFDYWMRLRLIQVRKVDHSLAKAMQRASSHEEWKSQGIKLFWDKKYAMAIMCFERAGEPMLKRWAMAASLRTDSDRISGSDPKAARKMLREAAEMFYSLGKSDSAAECFYDLKEYERAGRIYLEKSGESDLRKAGECFTLAGCYRLAADVYGKGNFFTECLSVCYKGLCFDKGLHYIEYWKQQASTTGIKRHKDYDKIGQEFMENCASYYYKLNDNISAMKFVRAFHTMESKRNFLMTLDRLEDLLLLEEESANFLEAAEIAKQLGDLLLEVDLLGKAENFTNASLLTLAYVLSFSLWGCRSKGWPLKSFPQKRNLITKAMSFAEKKSRSFSEFVSTTVKVLSHEHSKLFELMQYFSASKRHENLMAEILCVRKILDAHFRVNWAKCKWEIEVPTDLKKYSEERILRNQVSARTLSYFWNLCKEYILDILKSLDCLERQDFSKCKRTVEFCLNYFGVRRLSNNLNVSFLLLNPEANWVKNIDKRFILQHRNVVSVDTHHYVSASRNYWLRELLFVGIKVLRVLEALNNSSMEKSLSKYCQISSLTCIFDIAKVFIESPTRKFQNFVELSFKYFDIVFPLDSRMSLSENIVSLRKTELSRNLLEEVIKRNISTKNELTYGQIGRVVMIWLGSGRPKSDLYKTIVGKFPKTSSWKEFIEILGGIKESDSSASPLSNLVGLIQKFHQSLEETYYADRSVKGYMLPNCFLYLMERLVLLASQYSGSYFTTRSSFVEWLIYHESCDSSSASLVTDKQPYPRKDFDFLVSVVRQLLSGGCNTEKWRSCNINFKYYYPVLVLKLFVILCLLCLNSGMYYNVLFELLGSSQIRSQLQREFREALQSGRKYVDDHVNVNVNAVAEAFKIIGDPVVIVNFGENNLEFVYPNVIFLDMGVSPVGKKDIMEVLFPRSNETSHVQITCVEETKKISCSGLPLNVDNHGATSMASPLPLKMASKSDQNLSSENDNVNLEKKWGVLQEISDMLKSVENGKDGNSKFITPRKKAKVVEILNFLVAESTQFSEKKSPTAEDENVLFEAANTIEELKQLSSLLDLSDLDTRKIGEILKSLESRRPRLDFFFSRFVMQDDTNESIDSCDADLPRPVASGTQSEPNLVTECS
ncbi:uncharacterized protein Fot_40871 [Forsythia ovata]|uniref:UvrD-like helicase ATP-binding domain-containing protein n=1 Tax=Forsythia ovata TaxID=205694 RepID=A0ABD1RGM1_9LAMI